MSGERRPVIFAVSFWGPAFRKLFVDLCLASLLAPENLPALSRRRPVVLLMCTTPEDWRALHEEPLFQQAAGLAEIEFSPLTCRPPAFLSRLLEERARRNPMASVPPTVGPEVISGAEANVEWEKLASAIGLRWDAHEIYAMKLRLMSAGHLAAGERAFHHKAYLTVLAPDMALSNGALMFLDRAADAGWHVVQAAACRFDQTSCLDAFAAANLLQAGHAMALDPRTMVAIGFRNLHPETSLFDFDSDYFCDIARTAMWRVPEDDGALIHNFFWAPLLMDFGAVATHHRDYLDNGGTLDGRYLAMHFSDVARILSVTDSDDLMLMSFTPAAEAAWPRISYWPKNSKSLGPWWKGRLLRQTLQGPTSDAHKRQSFGVAVCLHSNALSPHWTATELRAARVVNSACKRPDLLDRIIGLTVSVIVAGGVGRWLRQRLFGVLQAISKVMSGFCQRYTPGLFSWARAIALRLIR
jgi:hypothetical protein